ncbi:hypothetical protein HYW60_03560 [Candidatus Kaiserbacteria bacterium]|nr:hypothetical protein [Candidatus Kaiserbacteria bacterium]
MKELIASTILIVLLVLVLNPFHFWMPTNMQMIIVAGILAAFGAVAVFVLRERALDEREETHRSFAGRWAFLAGSALLVLAIVVQSFNHVVDPWLVVVLVAMVCAKLAARLYGDRYL